MTQSITYPFGAGGIVTRVVENGKGSPPVVLVHGLGARADRWSRNINVVAEAGYRAIAFDLPGHGFADKRSDFSHGAPGYALFLESLLDGLGIDRAILVGTSLGGHVSATFTCEHPQRVSGLMLVGSTGLFPLGAEACQRLAGRAVDRSRSGIDSKLRTVLFDPVHVTPELVDEEFRINNSPGTDQVFSMLAQYFIERLDQDVVGPRLAAITPRPPIELVWGAQDKSVPIAIGRQAERLLSPTLLRVIEGAAHAPYFERPSVFNPLLLAFLRSCQ